jgi:hypothetical protein
MDALVMAMMIRVPKAPPGPLSFDSAIGKPFRRDRQDEQMVYVLQRPMTAKAWKRKLDKSNNRR